MKAVRIHQQGDPDVMRYEECPDPTPGRGEALVRLQAIGVNFIDTYQRSGLYRLGLPATIGQEGAGIVAATGDGVTEVQEGDAVVYQGVAGSYADMTVVPSGALAKLPDGVDARTAAAVFTQGLTAQYLAKTTFPIKKGDRVLIHAGAGGVGLLLIQMAKRLGGYVFTTVSTDEKAQFALDAGADHVIKYTSEDFAEAVAEATGGRGVQVVYDSVGQTTFRKSMDCLVPRGYMVLFGQSSGPVEPFPPADLRVKSLFLTRPSLAHHTATREELLDRAGDVFDQVLSGDLKVHIHKTYPLADAARAHRDLEGRRTIGKLLLLP